MKLDLKFVPFFHVARKQDFPPPPPCPRVHLPGLFFFPSCPVRYLVNPSHCQDLNAAFSVCHIFSIRHSASFPWARQTRREREVKGGGGTGEEIKRRTPWITQAHTHKYACAHAGTYCTRLCLISLVVYQGDQEFNTGKFPVDKALFREAGANEWMRSSMQRRRRRRERRWKWRRWGEDDKRALWFNCLPDIFLLIGLLSSLAADEEIASAERLLWQIVTSKCFMLSDRVHQMVRWIFFRSIYNISLKLLEQTRL